MKNSIIITPVNQDISLVAEAVQLKNSLMELGFEGLRAFTSIMQHYLPKYKAANEVKKLDQWWRIRLKDAEVNSDVDMVLEKLKHE